MAAAAHAGPYAARPTPAPSVFTVSPPPRSGAPMAWSRVPPARRTLAAAGARPARLLVGVAAPRDLARLARRVRVVAMLPRLRAAEVAASPAVHALARLPWVRYVEPKRTLRRTAAPDDPLLTSIDPVTQLPYEWAFAHVGADQAQALTPGSPSILVGVVDSGVGAVPDLQGQVAQTWYFERETANASDTIGHGTFVSSIIAARANDGFGLAGFCGACRLAVFKVVDLSDASIAAAITQLVDAHVRIVNLSLGGSAPDPILHDAIAYAISAGVLVVAASGNESAGSVSYPAAYLQPPDGELGYGLAVGASDANDERAPFSNWGEALSLLAPGAFGAGCATGILGALPPVASLFEDPTACASVFTDPSGTRYAYASGTSFAAPEVAGVAALVWAANPALKNYEVANLLEQTARRSGGWTADRGWGVLDAGAAVAASLAAPPVAAVPAAAPQPAPTRRLSPITLSGARRVGALVVATATAQADDGSAVAVSRVRCTVTIGPAASRAASRFHGNVAQCAWVVPRSARAARGAVAMQVELSDGGVATRSRAFRIGS
jgi:subtilisin family serine protease